MRSIRTRGELAPKKYTDRRECGTYREKYLGPEGCRGTYREEVSGTARDPVWLTAKMKPNQGSVGDMLKRSFLAGGGGC